MMLDAALVLYISVGIIAGVNLFCRLADVVLDDLDGERWIICGLMLFVVLYVSIIAAAVWPLYGLGLLLRRPLPAPATDSRSHRPTSVYDQEKSL